MAIFPRLGRRHRQIFLSYAHEDEKDVTDLHQKLTHAGFKPWMDKINLKGGEEWKVEIEKAIHRSDIFLACLSPNSVDRPGVLRGEIREALGIWEEKLHRGIYLIPVRLKSCEIPKRLEHLQWIDLFEEDGWRRLVEAIKAAKAQQRINKLIPLLAIPLSLFVYWILYPRFAAAQGEVKQVSSFVTIDRPGSGWDVIAYSFVIAALIGLALWYLQRMPLRQMPPLNPMRNLAIAVSKGLAVMASIIIAAFFLSPFVLAPKVDAKTDISGRASDRSRYYYLFVRPVDSDRCWLQQPVPLSLDQDGKWWAGAFFGGTQGQRFEIIAVASPISLNPVTFSKPGSYPCAQIPENSERFVRVVIMN
jgi:hypothetical protein